MAGKRARPRDAARSKERTMAVQWRHRKWGRDNREPSTVGVSALSAGGCWCGEKNGHDRPGKADGAPHPR
jgi:hypothetical protein